MNFKTNVVELAAFKSTAGFSKPGENGKKITPENVEAENGNGQEIKGVQQHAPTPPDQGSGETPPPLSKKKKAGAAKLKAKAKGKAKAAPVTDVPSSMGHAHDADALTPTGLRLQYPMTYSTWKNRKHHCQVKGWPWATEWDSFAGFLKSMGPRPSADHTLDRIDNTVHAYGPGFCQWATKVQQNNNKGDNVVIVDPATGEIWTSHKLAKKHKVQLETIYKWRTDGRSELELIAGKKDPTLAKVDEILKKNGLVAPPKGVKAPEEKFNIEAIPKPDDWKFWRAIDIAFRDENEDEYPEVVFQQLVSERMQRRKAEYDDLVSRAKTYNAGLPLPPKPEREFYKPSPSKVFTPPAAPPPSYLPKSYHDQDHDEVHEEDFDPADEEHDEEFDPGDYGAEN